MKMFIKKILDTHTQTLSNAKIQNKFLPCTLCKHKIPSTRKKKFKFNLCFPTVFHFSPFPLCILFIRSMPFSYSHRARETRETFKIPYGFYLNVHQCIMRAYQKIAHYHWFRFIIRSLHIIQIYLYTQPGTASAYEYKYGCFSVTIIEIYCMVNDFLFSICDSAVMDFN